MPLFIDPLQIKEEKNILQAKVLKAFLLWQLEQNINNWTSLEDYQLPEHIIKKFALTAESLHLKYRILWRPRKDGKTGDRFEIVDEFLGRGAFGSTYKTKGTLTIDKDLDKELDLHTNKIRAIKFFDWIKPTHEANLALRIKHLHAKEKVRLRPHASKSWFYALVMRYFPGCTLQALLSECIHTLALSRRCRLTINILEAYQDQVIKQNIIHRDLKPANIIIGENDVVSIIDYGSACCLRQSSETLESPAISPVSNGDLSKDDPVFPPVTSETPPLIELIPNVQRKTGKTGNFNIGIVGTLGFIPPEGYEHKPFITPKYDFFALARIIAEIWESKVEHYRPIQYKEAEEAAKNMSYTLPSEVIPDPDLKRSLELLLERLSAQDPIQRPEIDEVKFFFQTPSALHEDRVPAWEDKRDEHVLSLLSLPS